LKLDGKSPAAQGSGWANSKRVAHAKWLRDPTDPAPRGNTESHTIALEHGLRQRRHEQAGSIGQIRLDIQHTLSLISSSVKLPRITAEQGIRGAQQRIHPWADIPSSDARNTSLFEH